MAMPVQEVHRGAFSSLEAARPAPHGSVAGALLPSLSSRFRRSFLPLRVRPCCAGVRPEVAAGELHGPTAVGVRGAGTFFGRLLSLGDVVCADAGLVLRLYSGLPGAGLGDGRARVDARRPRADGLGPSGRILGRPFSRTALAA